MSETTSVARAKHVKFDQDDVGDDIIASTTVGEPGELDNIKTRMSNLSDDDSDDDSDAPVEEGISDSKAAVEAQLKQRDLAIEHERESLKAKRRKQNAMFKEQQAAKRSRIEEERAKNASMEAQDNDSQGVEEEQVEQGEQLEALDEELLRAVDTPDTVTSKHINFAELEAAEALQIQKRDRIRKKKANMLKSLRKQTVKRGPVNVTVLTPETNLRVIAPKREAKVANLRNKWLSRKSLRKRR